MPETFERPTRNLARTAFGASSTPTEIANGSLSRPGAEQAFPTAAGSEVDDGLRGARRRPYWPVRSVSRLTTSRLMASASAPLA